MPNGFGYHNDVAGVNYYGQSYNRGSNWNNLALGAGLGFLFGFPLLGLGLGAILGNNGGQNTNIININTNTERRRYC